MILIAIWPTVAKNFIFVQVQETDAYQSQGFNMAGQKVLEQDVISRKLDLTNLYRKHYVIYIVPKGFNQTFRFLKVE